MMWTTARSVRPAPATDTAADALHPKQSAGLQIACSDQSLDTSPACISTSNNNGSMILNLEDWDRLISKQAGASVRCCIPSSKKKVAGSFAGNCP
jgi:hypothetical protein